MQSAFPGVLPREGTSSTHAFAPRFGTCTVNAEVKSKLCESGQTDVPLKTYACTEVGGMRAEFSRTPRFTSPAVL